MSLYKHKVCFFIYSSFLAGKEAKEAGGTYEWFPLDPLSTSDRGSAPLGRPCSMGRVSTSGRVLQKKYRAGDVPPPRYIRIKFVRGGVFVSRPAKVEKYRAGEKRKKAKSGGGYPGQRDG